MSDRAFVEAGLLGQDEVARFVRRGHFAYESGDHGDAWLALELLFGQPRRLQAAAARLAERLRGHPADFVCGPLVGGALLGQWVACELNVGFVFAEAQAGPGPGKRYAIPGALGSGLAGKRVILVDDAINAGSAARACLREIHSRGGTVTALASLIVRAAAVPELRRSLGLPVEALLEVAWEIWPASDCPPCRAHVPFDDDDDDGDGSGPDGGA